MIKITMSDRERSVVEHTFKTTTDPRLRVRCQAMLMAARGRRHHHIAVDVGVHVRTLQRWLNAYKEQGLSGLPIRWAPGRTPKIPEPLAPEILTWVKDGPTACGLDRANWTYTELATHLYRTHGITVSASTMRAFCTRHGVRPYRPTYRYLKANPAQQEAARQDLQRLKKKAEAGDLVLLSQDEARFSMIPTLRTTLGSKGHRPIVGNVDCRDRVEVFGALTLGTGRLTTRLVEQIRAKAQKQKGASKQRALQEGFARHLRDIARASPAQQYPHVVLVGDRASWHRGALITKTLKALPHMALYRLPSYSPSLQVIERFWKVLRRRATHNRLFETLAQLKQALRNSLCYYQTLKHRVLSLIQSTKNQIKLSAA